LLNQKKGMTIEVLATPIDQTKEKLTIQDLEEIKVIIGRRIEALGANTYSITINEKEQRLEIKTLLYNDLEMLKNVLKRTGSLKITDENAKVILTNQDIKTVSFQMRKTENDIEEPVVEIQLDTEGTRLFAEGTKANIGKTISFFIDDQCYMTPTVNEIVKDGNLVITFVRSSEIAIQGAREAAALLQGRLEATLEIIKAEKHKVSIIFNQ